LWIVLATAAAAGLALFYLPWLAGLILCAPLVPYAWITLRLHALLRHPESVVAIRCAGAALSYQLKDGTWLNGKVQTGGLVNRWITVVRVRDASEQPRIRYIVLVPGKLSAEHFRLVRVHLQWARREEGAVL
jgi:hypothetical protein